MWFKNGMRHIKKVDVVYFISWRCIKHHNLHASSMARFLICTRL